MLMKLYMQDFVERKTTNDEICDALQEVSYEDKKIIKMIAEHHCHSEARRCAFQTTEDWQKSDLLV